MFALLAFFTNEPRQRPHPGPQIPQCPVHSDREPLHELLLQAPAPDHFVVEDERHQLVSQLNAYRG